MAEGGQGPEIGEGTGGTPEQAPRLRVEVDPKRLEELVGRYEKILDGSSIQGSKVQVEDDRDFTRVSLIREFFDILGRSDMIQAADRKHGLPDLKPGQNRDYRTKAMRMGIRT